MNVAALLLALPFLAAAWASLWWLARRLPRGRPSLLIAFGALLALPSVAGGLWWLAAQQLTRATYVCTECGQAEEQARFADWTCSRTGIDAGEEYARRFAPPAHAHDWHFEGCRQRGLGKVECNMERIEGWFRALPLIADRAAADELVREARTLRSRERARLMDEVTSAVWLRQDAPGGLDAVFAAWRARRSALPAPK